MKDKFLSLKYRGLQVDDNTSGNTAKGYDDLINLSIGDPDIKTPEIIINKAFEDALNGYTKYAPSKGYDDLCDEIALFYKNRYDLNVKNNEIFISTAGTVAMYDALNAVIDENDEVLIIEPYFFPYKDQIEAVGGKPVYVKTYIENDFKVDIKDLENAVTDKTKVLIINTPNNPTGTSFTKQELCLIRDFVVKYDLLVIADDIYTSFTYDGKFVPICSLDGMFERCITINSFSKNFIMTGFRIGNIVAPEYIINAINIINDNIVFSAPTISQRAALHGLRHFEEFEQEIVDIFKKRIEYSVKRIESIPFMKINKVNSGFYVFPNIECTGLTGEEFADKLLKEAHIQVIPGVYFGESGKYNIRISCTVSIEKLKEAFDRIENMNFKTVVN